MTFTSLILAAIEQSLNPGPTLPWPSLNTFAGYNRMKNALPPDVQKVRLTVLPPKLAALTGCEPPSYWKVWQAAVKGLYPAELVGGRWQVALDDLPKIAAALKMTAP